MNDDLRSLFEYNRWADARVLSACRKLSADQYIAEPVPGWSSVRATLTHIAIVTEGWIRGLTGENVVASPAEADLPTVDDAERHLHKAYATFEAVLSGHDNAWLEAPMLLRGAGRSAVMPPWAVIRHVVNHATYHRGQIASKLGRFGMEPPATDLIYWAFEKVPQGG
jgi:uncharacterized damage-inducible protein DinB